MIRRAYDAIVLDIDGTLVDDTGEMRPASRVALERVRAAGVRVMLATGRSEGATIPLLRELGLDTPALLYNGAGLYCPRRERLIEERLIADRTVAEALVFARERELLTVMMRYGEKCAQPPRDDEERAALGFLEDLRVVPDDQLPVECILRITMFSRPGDDPQRTRRELEAEVDRPMYLTHFPLKMLSGHRESSLWVTDIQPPCRGKAEALRVLEETYGIPPERVVAVGDAANDVQMLEAAGLGVAIGNGMPEAIAAADRVIGSNNTDAVAELLDELFG